MDKNELGPKKYIIWKCNGKDKGGEFEIEDNPLLDIKAKEDYDDDIAAAVGWGVAGVVAWYVVIGFAIFNVRMSTVNKNIEKGNKIESRVINKRYYWGSVRTRRFFLYGKSRRNFRIFKKIKK